MKSVSTYGSRFHVSGDYSTVIVVLIVFMLFATYTFCIYYCLFCALHFQTRGFFWVPWGSQKEPPLRYSHLFGFLYGHRIGSDRQQQQQQHQKCAPKKRNGEEQSKRAKESARSSTRSVFLKVLSWLCCSTLLNVSASSRAWRASRMRFVTSRRLFASLATSSAHLA